MERQLLSKEIIDLLEFRIQQEEISVRIYKQMALWLQNKGYSNLAALFNKYSSEEKSHANWACDFLLSYGVTPELKPLTSPVIEINSCMEVLEAALDHELLIEKQCNDLTFKAFNLKHAGLHKLGLKYCKEQVEEVSKIIDLIDNAKLTSDMLVFDHYVEKYL